MFKLNYLVLLFFLVSSVFVNCHVQLEEKVVKFGGLMCASEKGDMESPGEETGRAAHPAPQPNGSNKIIGRNVNGTSKSQKCC